MFLVVVVVVLVPLLLVVAAELQSEDVLWIEVAEVFRTPLQLRDPRLMIRAPQGWPGPGVRVLVKSIAVGAARGCECSSAQRADAAHAL